MFIEFNMCLLKGDKIMKKVYVVKAIDKIVAENLETHEKITTNEKTRVPIVSESKAEATIQAMRYMLKRLELGCDEQCMYHVDVSKTKNLHGLINSGEPFSIAVYKSEIDGYVYKLNLYVDIEESMIF